jgi:hypothetical protein
MLAKFIQHQMAAKKSASAGSNNDPNDNSANNTNNDAEDSKIKLPVKQ